MKDENNTTIIRKHVRKTKSRLRSSLPNTSPCIQADPSRLSFFAPRLVPAKGPESLRRPLLSKQETATLLPDPITFLYQLCNPALLCTVFGYAQLTDQLVNRHQRGYFVSAEAKLPVRSLPWLKAVQHEMNGRVFPWKQIALALYIECSSLELRTRGPLRCSRD